WPERELQGSRQPATGGGISWNSPMGSATAAVPSRQADPGSFLHGGGVQHLHGLVDRADAIRIALGILVFLGLVAQLVDLVLFGIGQFTLIHGFVQLVEPGLALVLLGEGGGSEQDRKSTRLNSSHVKIS